MAVPYFDVDCFQQMTDRERGAYAEALALEIAKPLSSHKQTPAAHTDAPAPFVPIFEPTNRRTKHATLSGYTSGCRCNPCRAAQAKYKREWSARRKAMAGV